MLKLFDLSGRRAIVTGGNGGIGLAMASALTLAGADLVICGRSASKNAQALGELRIEGRRIAAFQADVAKEADCRSLVNRAADFLGGIDILINNAGINIRRAPEEYSIEEWNTLISTNLTSSFIMSKEALGYLKVRGGKIINIGSLTSVFGAPFAAPYSVGKGGIVQLTKSLAAAWAKYGIQVNAILPGWTETSLAARLRADIPDIDDKVLARTPAGRWGIPSDFAGAAIFLASSASDFITGTALPVDGGYSSQV